MSATTLDRTPADAPVTHVVRSWPEFFVPILDGSRHHELREDDRGYRVGDILELHEWDPRTQEYSGRTLPVRATSITSDERPCAVSGAGLTPDS